MSPWPWISSLGRASIEGSLLILGVWLVCRSWRTLPAWARSGLWWLASARLLVALAPWTPVSVPTPFVAWWPAAIAAPPSTEAKPMASLLPSAVTVPSAGLGAAAPVSEPAPPLPRRSAFPRIAPRTWGIAALLLWGLGVMLRLAGMARQYARVRRLRRAASATGADVPVGLETGPGVRVALHEGVRAPMVTGLLRPLVLLPTAMIERPDHDVRLAVAHELSHVRRGDLWLAWIPALAEALFWFHPLVSLCAREYVQACEEACDEDALRATGAHPYEYGRLLLAIGVDRRSVGAGAIAFGPASPRQLVRRLSMLKHVRPLNPRVRTAALSLVCAFALVGLAPVRVIPASGTPKLAKAIAPAVAEEGAQAAAAEAPAWAGSLAPNGAPGAASAVATGSAPGAATGTMEKDPPPPDDPEINPSDDDDEDSGDLDRDDDWGEYDDDDTPAVPPVPPVPPMPPVAPVAPRAPLTPRPYMTMPGTPAPRARVAERGYHYSYSHSDSDDLADRFAYVLVHGGDESMNGSGNSMDWDDVRRLRARHSGDFLWVRVGDRKYLIDDGDILARVEEAFAPQTELGERQSRLGSVQSRIGSQQSRLGQAQSRVGQAQSEIGQRQAELAARMARRQARGADTSEFERMADELSNQMESLSRQQERLSEQMEPLSRQQEELGSQMEEMGRQMERLSRTTNRQVRTLIDRAIQSGDAKPLR